VGRKRAHRMTPILDLTILITGILIYLALLALAATHKPKLKPLKGSRIIVKAKAKNKVIHIGLIDHFDGDVVICYNSNGQRFVAWASHLFWSESEQAFIERV
jgi:hypothetical protein